MIDLSKDDSIQAIIDFLESENYIADRSIATSVFLSQRLNRPLLIEGRAGVGKTEIGTLLAKLFNTDLIRLQCYEGLDTNTAVYEWNYAKQLLYIKLEESDGKSISERKTNVFNRDFLMERPLLSSITNQSKSPILLIDEVDRADEEFEAFLLELLSEFQVTIPEIGTIKAKYPPIVILTSNRTRELSDALRRRCLYLWIDYPSFDKELKIIRTKLPDIDESLSDQIVRFVEKVRTLDLNKTPGISETLDWVHAIMVMKFNSLDDQTIEHTLNALIKNVDDLKQIKESGFDEIFSNT